MVATCRRPATSKQQSGGLASRFWAESNRGRLLSGSGVMGLAGPARGYLV